MSEETGGIDREQGTKEDTAAGNIDLDKVKEKLRLWTEDVAIALRERGDRYTAAAAVTFAQLGRELNKVTGYQQIEKLKGEVVEQGVCNDPSW